MTGKVTSVLNVVVFEMKYEVLADNGSGYLEVAAIAETKKEAESLAFPDGQVKEVFPFAWQACQNYVEEITPTATEAKFLSLFPGVKIVGAYWYGQMDANMWSVAFVKGSQIAWLPDKYNRLDDYLADNNV